jgi:acyl-ACP thioesterase
MIEIPKTDLIHLSNFKVTTADTDMIARIRLSSLENLLVQSAINSADSLGFGLTGIKKEKLFWVLSRLHIDIYRPLKWYEETVVETWPKNLEGLLYLRDFIVRDKNQNIIAKATSGWLAIDFETKRPNKIDGVRSSHFNLLKEKHAIEEIPEKLSAVSEGHTYEVISTYFDIDVNKHVTSSRYIDWMMDSFTLDFHQYNYPQKLIINYMRETMPGEKIRICRQEKNKNYFHFEGINLNSNTVAFRAVIEF